MTLSLYVPGRTVVHRAPAGLALGLGGAVEAAGLGGDPPHHRPHRPALRRQRQQGPLHPQGGQQARLHRCLAAAQADNLHLAQLAGLQRPRGWGLFLITNMVDDVRESTDGHRHLVELVMRLDDEQPVDDPEGDDDGDA